MAGIQEGYRRDTGGIQEGCGREVMGNGRDTIGKQ